MTNRNILGLTLAVCFVSLAVLLLIGIQSDDSDADSSGTCGTNVRWSYSSTSEILTISGSGPMSTYYNYFDVPWKSNAFAIKEVRINDGVTSIASYSFYECKNLSEVSIADSVKSIGEYAFYCDFKLTGIDLPANLETIWGSAFYGTGITELTIPDSVKSISNQSFKNVSLKKIDFGKGLTSVDPDSFGSIQFYDSNGQIPISVSAFALRDSSFSGANGILYADAGSSSSGEIFSLTNFLCVLAIVASIVAIVISVKALYNTMSN